MSNKEPRRAYGGGTIQERNGRYRVRVPHQGTQRTLGTYPTRGEAEAALAHAIAALHQHVPQAGVTLAQHAAKWFDAREVDGLHRDVQNDRHAAKRWLRSDLADVLVVAITPKDVRAWVAAQVASGAARQTIANALNLLRGCLASAVDADLAQSNPANDVRVPRVATTKDAWTWLRPDELAAVCAAAPPELADIITVAAMTGVRAGELFGLRWADVHGSELVVRHSWGDRATKSGRVRTVPLLHPASAALQRQRQRSGSATHVFPSSDHEPRTKNQTPSLAQALKAAGVHRHVRFHDLRHTCASLLLQGAWAPQYVERALTIAEVAVWLGHTTSATTQRYAHLCPRSVGGLVVQPTKTSKTKDETT